MRNKIVRYIAVFIAGFLLMFSLSIFMDWRFEEEVVNNLAIHVRSKCQSSNKQDIIRTALHDASYLDERNTELLGDKTFKTLRVNLMSESFAPYWYGGGACGGYSLFLSRLLRKMGFETKVIQLRANGVFGAHISLGIVDGNRILLIDPLYNLAYKDSVGNLVDIHEVANNWNNYYRYQVPQNYNLKYNYQEGWRFTNWDKFGSLSRGIYKIGVSIYGSEKMKNYCFASNYSSLFRTYFVVSFLGFLIFTSFLIKELFLKKQVFIKNFKKVHKPESVLI